MDTDLAWVNGKSGRQSWCYADVFQRSIISEAIYHFFHGLAPAGLTEVTTDLTVISSPYLSLAYQRGPLITVLSPQFAWESVKVKSG